MIDFVLLYPNGGAGGGSGGGSMGVSIPPGTLYDTSWLDSYGSRGDNLDWSSYGNIGNSSGERGGNGRIGASSFSSLKPGSASILSKNNDDLSVDYGEQFSTIDYGLRGKVTVIGGLALTLTQSINSDYSLLGLSFNFLAVNNNGFGITLPTPWIGVALTAGFQYKGIIIVGTNIGPAFVRVSFSLENLRNGLEEWHREALSRIYSQQGLNDNFNMSQVP